MSRYLEECGFCRMVVLLLNREGVGLRWGVEQPLEKGRLGHERPGGRKRASGWFFAVVVVVCGQEIREGERSVLIVSAFLHATMQCWSVARPHRPYRANPIIDHSSPVISAQVTHPPHQTSEPSLCLPSSTIYIFCLSYTERFDSKKIKESRGAPWSRYGGKLKQPTGGLKTCSPQPHDVEIAMNNQNILYMRCTEFPGFLSTMLSHLDRSTKV